MELIEQIKRKATSIRSRIVLPEGTEERTIKAADKAIEMGLARIILLGDPERIGALASEYGLKNIGKATVIDPRNNPKKDEYVRLMVSLRGSKGVTEEIAASQLLDPLYLGAIMIKAGDADGEVAGADNATGDVLRPAFQYVKTKPGCSVVSGAFLMDIPDKQFGDDGLMVFADCAVHPNPTAEELAEIAVMTAKTTRDIAGIEPRVAMLSFSTKGSAKNPMVDKVVEATALAHKLDPSVELDGELQADAAIIPVVAAKKAPGSSVAGKANVLVFPTLEVGNIAYKLVQRMAHATAVGPVLQGMAAPINDLSRGCSVEDIVGLIAITVCQTAQK